MSFYNKLFCVLLTSVLFNCGGSSTKSEASTPIIPETPSTPETPTTPTPSSSPNILLIIADDQGVDASAQYSYSSDVPNTPALDTLASQGIVFEHTWATPACTTTRATMMTGQFGINSGVTYVPAKMDSNLQTLPKYIKAANSNYTTAAFGKWHLGGGNADINHPLDSGFDYYAGNINGTIDDYYNWPLVINGQTSTSTEYHTTKVTELALDWINQQSKPWFAWLAYVAPHSPFHLPPTSLQNRAELSGNATDIANNKRAYYLAAIEALDTEIGYLLAGMSAETLANTVIIYIGDNGTPAPVIDHTVFAQGHNKDSLYEGGILVPMIISGKGVERINSRESALINSTDLFATIGELTGINNSSINDSVSFASLLVDATANTNNREFNYAEFQSDSETGWTVRNNTYKLIHRDDGSEQLFNLQNSVDESTDLLQTNDNYSDIVALLTNYANTVRQVTTQAPIDITNQVLTNQSSNCQEYAENYQSNVMDVNRSQVFTGSLEISVANGKCSFHTNEIPNHDFNDGSSAFPNNVSEQNKTFAITTSPTFANSTTELDLTTDNAILLNGVKVDLIAAACFGVSNGKIGCNDMQQAWRYDPTFAANGFKVDSHNAHVQPDGSYHYHASPKALFNSDSSDSVSPVIGFAADGFPIYGSYFDDNGVIRKAFSSYRLKSGTRPTSNSQPGGNYDGSYRDDYEYIANDGDLDECNGMMVNGHYAYFITDSFPYILNCFKGTPDPSFNK